MSRQEYTPEQLEEFRQHFAAWLGAAFVIGAVLGAFVGLVIGFAIGWIN
jgi:hypothetical protein